MTLNQLEGRRKAPLPPPNGNRARISGAPQDDVAEGFIISTFTGTIIRLHSFADVD